MMQELRCEAFKCYWHSCHVKNGTVRCANPYPMVDENGHCTTYVLNRNAHAIVLHERVGSDEN